MRRHEHTPLRADPGLERDPSRPALFESILAFENYPLDGPAERQAGSGSRISGLASRSRPATR